MSFVKFERQETKGKTDLYLVANAKSNILLGEIKWISGWRRYGFFPSYETYFDAACLNEIAIECSKLTEKQKENWK